MRKMTANLRDYVPNFVAQFCRRILSLDCLLSVCYRVLSSGFVVRLCRQALSSGFIRQVLSSGFVRIDQPIGYAAECFPTHINGLVGQAFAWHFEYAHNAELLSSGDRAGWFVMWLKINSVFRLVMYV